MPARYSEAMHVVLIGNTGSGKSTVAKGLEEHLGIPRVSSGDIARKITAVDPAQALALNAGLPGPEDAMRLHVREALETADAQTGSWILEGFPYMVEQLVCIAQWTSVMPVFVHLDITEWAIVERLIARNRPDDTPDSIARKFARFREKTIPMLDMLDRGGVLQRIEVDGHGPSEVIELVKKSLT